MSSNLTSSAIGIIEQKMQVYMVKLLVLITSLVISVSNIANAAEGINLDNVQVLKLEDTPLKGTNVIKRDLTKLKGEAFNYAVVAVDAHKRRMEVFHEKRYEGSLAEMPFRERHLQVFRLTMELMKANCPTKVASLGNIVLSKDPELDTDPDASEPKFFSWEYTCE